MEEIKDRDEPYTDENGNRVVPASALDDPIELHQHIVLADGTDIDTGRCSISTLDNSLWVWTEKESGYNMMTLFPIFTNPEKTKKIKAYYLDAENPTVYEGFTEMVNINTDYSGKTSINLRYHASEEVQ